MTSCGAPAPRPTAPAPVAPAPVAPPVLARDGRPEVPLATAPEGAMTIAFAATQPVAAAGTVTALSEARTHELLARMEPLPAVAPAGAPSLRPPSAPPPRAGAVQPIAFVAPAGKPVGDAPLAPTATVEPLVAPTILPTGEVAAEAEVRIRFAQAMVPVAKIGPIATPPARIAPPVAGTWRWIDTRVLGFFAQGARLPQATTYTVTVPAGTRALSGATLASDATGTFATKPLGLAGVFPTRVRPDTAIALQLDAAVDPAQVLPLLRVQTRSGKRIAVHAVDRAAAAATWTRMPHLEVRDRDIGAHVVFVAPDTAWPSAARDLLGLQVVLATGAATTEGPRRTTKPAYAGFEVVPPFTLRGLACDGPPRLAGAVCGADNAISVVFSATVEESSYRAEKIQIVGEEARDHYLSDDSVSVWTPNVVGKRFAIAIGDGLVDGYGQPYTGPRRIAFTTKPHRYEPMLDMPTGMHVIDPRFQIPQLVIGMQSIAALRVQLYKVTPADYFAYERLEGDARATPPGQRFFDTTYTIGARRGADLRVDLRPALTNGTGHVVAIVTPTPLPGTPRRTADEDGWSEGWGVTRQTAWIQVTRLGISARHDGEKLTAWARELAPARFLAPIANATLSIVRSGERAPVVTAQADAEGHATLALPAARTVAQKSGPPREVTTPSLVVAEANGDTTFVAFGHDREKRSENAYWYVTDDRFTYKPGEPVYVKGWVRWSHDGVNPQLAAPARGDTVAWTLHDARRNQLASGTATLSDQGGFDVKVDLPPTANLGTALFSFETRGDTQSHAISIQEFRTPAYLVALADDTQYSGARPLYAGEAIEMRAEAKYFAGGGLPGADIRWEATLAPTTFTPPNWDRFTFRPIGERSKREYYWRSSHDGARVELGEATTLGADSASTATLAIAETPHHAPSLLKVDTTVADLDRMQIRASSRAILVHPSTLYVGLRAAPNRSDVIEAIVTDVDGAPVAGIPVAVELEAVLGSERYRDDAKVVESQRCALTSGTTPVACPWKRGKIDWAYTAYARVRDARGRENTAAYVVPYRGGDDTRELALGPDKPSYRPGETAKVTITSATVPATAVVTIARNGVVRQQQLALTQAATTIDVPIEAAFIANVHVVVDRWSIDRTTRGGSSLPFPQHESQDLELEVDTESARLAMTTTPERPIVEPGAEAGFTVTVRKDGAPVANAEVALIVVDEAILSLSGERHADPLEPFYRSYPARAQLVQTFSLVRDQGPELAGVPGFKRYDLDELTGHGSGTGSGFGLGGGAGGVAGGTLGGAAIVEARKDFRPVAVFSPLLHTDAAGMVTLRVKLPDNLTRYRIVALATANTGWFGKAENTIVAQRTINARTVAPRFLTQGDRFSLPILVQNLGPAPREVDVAVRAANLVASGPQGKHVTLAAGQRAEVRFDFATAARGKAVIQTIVVAGAQTDASNVELPVWEPTTTEAFATYGVVDDKPAFEQLAVPRDVFPDVGGVELEVASTQLQALTDAYWYLQAYPYECAEQRSGRMLATAAMTDILDAFRTPGRPSADELAAQRQRDIDKLTRDQLANGGWGYFPGMDADPFVTAQVLAALAAVKAPGPARGKAVAYVTRLVDGELAALAKLAAVPEAQRAHAAGAQAYRVALVAADLAALDRAGVEVRPRVTRLHALATTLGAYPMDAKARVLALVARQPGAAAIRSKLLADVLSATHETASAATVTAAFVEEERLLLVSSTRTTALALDALMREAPEQALVPKLARGLLDARASGRWRTTQDNLVVLTTMRRYFDTYEKVEPQFRSKIWLGKAAYAETAFVGRTTERGVATAGWGELAPGTTHDVAITKDGPGRLYYRVGITYAPARTDLPALDAGFVVRRTYTAVDDPADVTKLADGRWRIKLGARVLVTVQALNTTLRHGVALVDPLPAGLEPVNTALATAERAARSVGDTRWDFRALRDNRAEAFAMRLGEGTHQFSYTARATTPGTFVAAPAKAEEMYSPETFGRSGGVTVVIE